mmetsp:Transcript_153154/g.267603  ORF Transcript_153154/g.267603 Transcript_153154/m.267603 type:complete len:201 (+) Transcript_153154:945-1547(+)
MLERLSGIRDRLCDEPGDVMEALDVLTGGDPLDDFLRGPTNALVPIPCTLQQHWDQHVHHLMHGLWGYIMAKLQQLLCDVRSELVHLHDVLHQFLLNDGCKHLKQLRPEVRPCLLELAHPVADLLHPLHPVLNELTEQSLHRGQAQELDPTAAQLAVLFAEVLRLRHVLNLRSILNAHADADGLATALRGGGAHRGLADP